VVAGRDEQQRRGVRAEPVEGQEPGGTGGHERDDQLVQALELGIEELRAPSQFAQRDTDGIRDDVTGPGPQRCRLGDQRRRGVLGEPGSQVIGPGITGS
jgi:hypothetical protein